MASMLPFDNLTAAMPVVLVDILQDCVVVPSFLSRLGYCFLGLKDAERPWLRPPKAVRRPRARPQC